MKSIPIEQAVYGSFPFWDRGYALMTHSPGCRAEWLDVFTTACSKFGERPRDVCQSDALFSLRLNSGLWMIVGVREQGADDRGRPALAFHALFVSEADYRRVGGSPFAFARWHRGDWRSEAETLPALSVSMGRDIVISSSDLDSRAARIAQALSRGQRVAVIDNRPIDDLARAVWARLSPRQRARKTVATWAFGTENHFDLVGLPARPNVTIPGGYTSEAVLADRPSTAHLSRSRPLLRSASLLIAALGVSAWQAPGICVPETVKRLPSQSGHR